MNVRERLLERTRIGGRARPVRVRYVGTGPDAAETATELEDGNADLVVERVDGEAALERLEEVDCVVSEYRLEGNDGSEPTDGLSLLEAVRERDAELPFILYADRGNEAVASEAISAGVTDYVRMVETEAEDDAERPRHAVLGDHIRNAVESYRAATEIRKGYQALEAAQEGISVLDADGDFLYVNEAYAGIYGYDRSAFIGNHWTMIYPDDDAGRVSEEILPTVREKGWWRGETTGLRSDGETFPEDHSLKQLEDGGLICTVRDVSDYKCTEKQLRYERNVKDRIIEASPVGITITDSTGTMTFTNDRAEQIIGIDGDSQGPENVTDWEVVDENGEPIPPEELPFRRILDGDEARFDRELGVVRPDGELVWLSMNGAPLRASTGGDTRAIITFTDVTERVELEDEREAILERVTDAFFALDDEWNITYLNDRAQEWINPGSDSLVGENVWEQFPDAVDSTFEAEYRRAMAEQETVSFEEYYPAPLDAWFRATAYPSETGLSVYFRDVTEEKERAEELQRREAFQHKLSEISSNTDLSFDQKLTRLIELGCERFDVDIGFLSKVEGDSFRVVESTGPHEYIQPGATVNLGETYCRKVYQTDGPVTIDNAGSEGWEGDPAHEKYDLACYIGSQVFVDDDPYGTLCFADSAPRSKPFSEAEIAFLELMASWLSYELEQKHRERQLASLNEMMRDLINVETTDKIHEYVGRVAASELGLEGMALNLYDRDEDAFSPLQSAADDPDETEASSDFPAATAREAFFENRVIALDDERRPVAVHGEAPVHEVAVPIGKHGVLTVQSEGDRGLSESDLEFAQTVAQNLEATLDRADREDVLRERDETLQERNQSLNQLNRINTVIRQIDKALVGASTRQEIYQAVCSRLANTDPFLFAWIGEPRDRNETLSPRKWAGIERNYLKTVSFDSDEPLEGQAPESRALGTREPQVIQSIHSAPPYDPWQQEALKRGYKSCISVPLVYQGNFYGVLTVYATQAGVFDDLERTVFEELAGTIAHAVNAVASKKALVSSHGTELEFSITGADAAPVKLAAEAGCTVQLKKVVPRTDGGFRVFFCTRDASAEAVQAAAEKIVEVGDTRLVSERGDELLFESTVVDGSMITHLIDHGAVPDELAVDEERARLTVRLSDQHDIRSFVETLQSRYPEAELVAQRHTDESAQPSDLRSHIEDALTKRQYEVLQTAYLSGYFDTPRQNTASELADSLEISQPTFNNHLRKGQKRLFSVLLNDGIGGDD